MKDEAVKKPVKHTKVASAKPSPKGEAAQKAPRKVKKDAVLKEAVIVEKLPVVAVGEAPENAGDELDALLAMRNEEGEDIPEDPRAAEIRERDGVFFDGRYYYGIGRRKTSIAKVSLFTRGKEKSLRVNGMDYKDYFKLPRLIADIEKPLTIMKAVGKFGAKVAVSGGGIVSQAGAVRLGISRALVVFNAEFRKRLRRHGLLTRDSRMVERKKYGKRKARRSPQWSKR